MRAEVKALVRARLLRLPEDFLVSNEILDVACSPDGPGPRLSTKERRSIERRRVCRVRWLLYSVGYSVTVVSWSWVVEI
jgi:hypothetical protein